MKLVHITLFHQRPEMSAAWLRYMRGKNVAACVTEGDRANIALLEQHGVPYIEHANKPLGAKCNAALAFAMTMDPDAVMILPSDDFVSFDWTAEAMKAIEAGAEYVLPARCAMVEPWTGRACLLDQRNGVLGCGSGRIFSRVVVDEVGPLWTPEKPRALDFNSHYRVARSNGYLPHYLDGAAVPIVDVKSSRSIWRFDDWVRRGTHCTPADALSMLPDDIRAEVMAITGRSA